MNTQQKETKPSEGFSLGRELKQSLIVTAVMVLLLCAVYPWLVWGVGGVLFPHKAEGSLIRSADGAIVGSALLAQGFASPRYFHPRPSAAGAGWDAASSGGSNLGQTSRKLMDSVKARVERYRAVNGLAAGALVPADAVTASGSGLDPEISLQNALLQAPRVARERGLPAEQVEALVRRHLRGRTLGFLGEEGVNVLALNLSLDEAR
jgi:K+-transporting ATPase ATPase C chain